MSTKTSQRKPVSTNHKGMRSPARPLSSSPSAGTQDFEGCISLDVVAFCHGHAARLSTSPRSQKGLQMRPARLAKGQMGAPWKRTDPALQGPHHPRNWKTSRRQRCSRTSLRPERHSVTKERALYLGSAHLISLKSVSGLITSDIIPCVFHWFYPAYIGSALLSCK